MARKSILTAAVIWYFLMSGYGGARIRKGPFNNRTACETYRMRVARSTPTSDCIPLTLKKK